MLRTGRAAVNASVKFYHDNEKIIGYVIDGIGVVLGGLQLVAGTSLVVASLGTGNIVGVIAGASLISNGAAASIENIQKIAGKANPSNFMEDGYGNIAEFIGFDRKIGILAYQAVDLSTSYYGILKLSLKPETWRLFNYPPADYYRKISSMSRSSLALTGAGAAIKLGRMGLIYKGINEKMIP